MGKRVLVLQQRGSQPQGNSQGGAQVLAVFLRLDALPALFFVLLIVLHHRSSIHNAPQAKAQESSSPRVNLRRSCRHRRSVCC